MTDLRQNKSWARYLRASGWQVVGKPNSYAFIKKIPLTPFSIIKCQRPKKIPFVFLDQLAKKHRAFFTYVEPRKKTQIAPLKKNGYRLSCSPFLPTKTIYIDLTDSLAQIRAQMKKDGRYCLRQAEKNSLQLIKAPKIPVFSTAWTRRQFFWKPSFKNLFALKKIFSKNALFLAANHQNQIIAGTVILIAGKTAFYFYAFTNPTGRQKMAQYWLVWQAVKESKKRGCDFFDFEGIYDPRFSSKSWLGFSHFKKAFGGQEATYPGCFTKRNFFN